MRIEHAQLQYQPAADDTVELDKRHTLPLPEALGSLLALPVLLAWEGQKVLRQAVQPRGSRALGSPRSIRLGTACVAAYLPTEFVVTYVIGMVARYNERAAMKAATSTSGHEHGCTRVQQQRSVRWEAPRRAPEMRVACIGVGKVGNRWRRRGTRCRETFTLLPKNVHQPGPWPLSTVCSLCVAPAGRAVCSSRARRPIGCRQWTGPRSRLRRYTRVRERLP